MRPPLCCNAKVCALHLHTLPAFQKGQSVPPAWHAESLPLRRLGSPACARLLHSRCTDAGADFFAIWTHVFRGRGSVNILNLNRLTASYVYSYTRSSPRNPALLSTLLDFPLIDAESISPLNMLHILKQIEVVGNVGTHYMVQTCGDMGRRYVLVRRNTSLSQAPADLWVVIYISRWCFTNRLCSVYGLH